MSVNILQNEMLKQISTPAKTKVSATSPQSSASPVAHASHRLRPLGWLPVTWHAAVGAGRRKLSLPASVSGGEIVVIA